MFRPVAVAALVVLAGCTGLVSDGESDGTVTPVGIPGEVTPVEVPRTDGRVDIDRVITRHDAALSTRSFYRRVDRGNAVGSREVWVDRRSTGDVVRVRQSSERSVQEAVLVGNATYRPASRGDGYARADSDGSAPYVVSLSGAFTLRQFLAPYDYRVLGTVRRDGRSLAVLGANATLVYRPDPDPDETVDVASRVYVGRDGVIRAVDHSRRHSSGDEHHFRMRVRTGIERVPVPPWLDEAVVYPRDSPVSRHANGQSVYASMRGVNVSSSSVRSATPRTP
ncbi:hypothetical protein [Haloarcula nitratireducens]|uniref:Outer membrane lipoprotein n=1 Tax=Haloarcula nitratireducens TaxID=2487749 RepID=A0AAW4P5Y9_9EURY|nr:hypothetical protein [Halomicroarcula nitratireducens]MBX0293266.1 hypothetical protein [Halomicroarcula nitratireducens]